VPHGKRQQWAEERTGKSDGNRENDIYCFCGPRARLYFQTLPGIPRVSLNTATVASTPMTRNNAKQIAAITRMGIGHLTLIVRRPVHLFGDAGHRSQ